MTSTNSGTCTYGSAINLPTVPQKRGYTFKGWKVVPQYDFATLYNGTAGSASWGKGEDRNKPYCLYAGPGHSGWRVGCINNEFDDLQINEWKAQFSWGMIYGQALCSETSASSEGDIGTPSKTYGDYCWCKATGYHPSNTNTTYVPSNNLPWTYVSEGARNCRSRCPLLCSVVAYAHPIMRRSLFGVSGS